MEKINAVIIGAGVQGMVHVQAAVESPYVDKVYICDPDEKCFAKAKEKFGNVMPISYENALKDPSIRFASISSPNQFHIPQASDFMRQGKAVLLEKPMGATLEEAKNADLILNICDISSDQNEQQLEVTRELLNELGCENIPIITVYNKCDVIDMEVKHSPDFKSVFISAKEGLGIDLLLKCICENLSQLVKKVELHVPYSDMNIINSIRQTGTVLQEDYENDYVKVNAIVDKKIMKSIEKYMV